MTRDLEIDKEDFDAFVRENLQLAPEAPITEFHYALIEDKIANSGLDLENWLEKRRIPHTPVKPEPDSKAASKEAKKEPSKEVKKEPSQELKMAPKMAEKNEKTPPPASKTPPMANRTAPARSRKIKPKKGGFFRVVGGFISFLFLVAMGIYLVGWYLPFNFREKMATEEWLKSVPPIIVEYALFRHQSETTPLSLERGSPTSQIFASKQPFRINGNLELKSPASEVFQVKVAIRDGKTAKVEKKVTFSAGSSSQPLFDEVLESGEYTIDVTLDSTTKQSKIPATAFLKIKY